MAQAGRHRTRMISRRLSLQVPLVVVVVIVVIVGSRLGNVHHRRVLPVSAVVVLKSCVHDDVRTSRQCDHLEAKKTKKKN